MIIANNLKSLLDLKSRLREYPFLSIKAKAKLNKKKLGNCVPWKKAGRSVVKHEIIVWIIFA